jgi:hypothetical protein
VTVTGQDLYAQLAQLAQDVLEAVAAGGADAPDRVLVQPYGAIADDLGDGCSQLAVALDDLHRARTFPGLDVEGNVAPCSCQGEAVAVMRARITRCVSVPDDDGTPPTPEALSAEAALALIDTAALYEAACTFAARFDYALTGAVVPAGPEGGVGAYEVTVTVSPDDFTPAPEEP